MLEQTEWSKHKLSDLFDKVKVKSLKYKASELPSYPTEDYPLPALTAGILNQGLNNYVPHENATVIKNVISISANGANTGATFFQNKEFTILQDAYAIKYKKDGYILNEKQYLYLAGTVSKAIYGNYEWTNKAGWEKIKNNVISLPQKEGKIDYQFMEDFIAELEQARIAELEAYLIATGLNNYILTDKECAMLESFGQDKKIQWLDFTIDQLFDILTYKKRFDANKVEVLDTGYPYVVRTALNNGVKGYLVEDEQYLNDGNTISFGQDTATMFYQERPYFTGDKIKIVKAKFEEFNKIIAMYFLTTMGKAFSNFSWGSSSFSVKSIESQKIMLPSKDGKPDFGFMTTFISAIQKLVIKDVVLYADAKIESTKKVVN